jgi:hypothetical protein
MFRKFFLIQLKKAANQPWVNRQSLITKSGKHFEEMTIGTTPNPIANSRPIYSKEAIGADSGDALGST